MVTPCLTCGCLSVVVSAMQFPADDDGPMFFVCKSCRPNVSVQTRRDERSRAYVAVIEAFGHRHEVKASDAELRLREFRARRLL